MGIVNIQFDKRSVSPKLVSQKESKKFIDILVLKKPSSN